MASAATSEAGGGGWSGSSECGCLLCRSRFAVSVARFSITVRKVDEGGREIHMSLMLQYCSFED